MPESNQPDLDQLLTDVDHRERRSRRFAAIYSLVPVVLAVAFLWYTSQRVFRLNDEMVILETQKTSLKLDMTVFEDEIARLDQLATDLSGRNDAMVLALDESMRELEVAKSSAEEFRSLASQRKEELGQLQQTVKELQFQIHEAASLSKFIHRIDFTDLKGMQFRGSPWAGDIFLRIQEMDQRGIGWSSRQQSPETGFNSPRFANFVLQDLGVDVDFGGMEEVNDPQQGDILIYPSGYYMFYFIDLDREPFVFGMTPFGIASLKVDFAEVRRILRPPH